MEKVVLKSEHALDYVEEKIMDCLTDEIIIKEAKFHHNTKYKDITSVIEKGILSPIELNRLGVKGYDDDVISTMDDIESHANGVESVSVAAVGLSDISDDEFEYDPFNESQVDILLTSDIKARRYTANYGNEFLVDKSIDIDKFRAIDIRLLSLVQTIRENNNKSELVKELIDCYNKLRELAYIIKHNKVDVPIREMSAGEALAIDVDKISSMPKVKIK